MVKQGQLCRGVIRTSHFNDMDSQREANLSRIENLLLGGNLSNGLNLEKLHSGARSNLIFSLRLNRKARLLVTKSWMVNGWYWVFLKTLENHEYHRERLLQDIDIQAFLLPEKDLLEKQIKRLNETQSSIEVDVPDLEILDVTEGSVTPIQEEIVSSPKLLELEYFNSYYIQLSDIQKEVVYKPLPLMVIGSAGSGKSCIAFSLLIKAIETHDDIDARFLYVTKSAHLVDEMQQSFRSSPQYQPEDEIRLHFRTYVDLLGELIPETLQLQLVDKECFFEWFRKNVRQYAELAAHEEEVYQEFRLLSGYNKASYFALGQRRTLFLGEHRALIWQAYWKYCQFLADRKYLDLAFYPSCSSQINHKLYLETDEPLELPQFNLYDCGFVDETQDFSNLQQLMLFGVIKDRQLACFIDVNQSLQDSGAKTYFIKEYFSLSEHSCIQLPYSIRCAKKILHLSNVVLSMKHHLCGGLIEKDLQSYSPIPEDSEEGMIRMTPESEDVMRELQKDVLSTKCVVLADKKNIAIAQKLFSGNVMTVEQSKGLEYEKVICFRLLNQPHFEEINKEFKDWRPDFSITPRRPKAGEAKFNFGPKFNELYTAFTRAKIQVHILEDRGEKDHKLGQVIRVFKDVIGVEGVSESSISLGESSTEDWLREARLQLLKGNEEVAKHICQQRLGYSQQEFVRFDEQIKVSIRSQESPSTAHKQPVSSSPVPLVSKTPPPKLVKPKPKKASANPMMEFEQTLNQRFKTNDDGFKWLLDEETSDSRCLLEVYLSDYEKAMVFLNVLEKQEHLLDSFSKQLCRTRAQQLGKAYENDSGISVLTRYPVGIMTLNMLSPARLLKVMPSRLLAVVLSRPRTTRCEYLFNTSPLYWLVASLEGIAFLYKLLKLSPDIVNFINTDAMCRTTVNQPFSLKYSSVFFYMASSNLGQQLLARYKGLLDVIDVKTILQPLSPPLVNTEGMNLLYFLSQSVDGRLILKHLLRKEGKLLEALSFEDMRKTYLIEHDEQMSVLHLLCISPGGGRLLLQSPSLAKFFTQDLLCSELPKNVYAYKHASIFYILSSCVFGRKFLLENYELLSMVDAETLSRRVEGRGQDHLASSLMWLSGSDDGCRILELIFNINPNMVSLIDHSQLSAELEDEPAPLYFMCRLEEGRQLLANFPVFLEKASKKVLSRYYANDALQQKILSPLYLLSRHLETCEALLFALQQYPDFIQHFSQNSLYHVLDAKAGCLENTSVFYWLCVSKTGIQILSYLFEKNPKLLAALSVDALNAIRPTAAIEYEGTSAFYWLTHNQNGRELLFQYPEISAKVQKETLFQLVMSAQNPFQNISPMYWLCLKPIGHNILDDILSNRYFWLKDISENLLCAPKNALAGVSVDTCFLLDLLLEEYSAGIFYYMLELTPSLAYKINATALNRILRLTDFEIENTSLFYWLCATFYGRRVFNKLLDIRPDIVKGISSQALCIANDGYEPKYKNYSALYKLSESIQSRQLFARILDIFPEFIQLITVDALCLPLTQASGDKQDASPLFWLSSCSLGQDILKNFFLIENISIWRSFNYDQFYHAAPKVYQVLGKTIENFLTYSELGKNILETAKKNQSADDRAKDSVKLVVFGT